MESLRCPFVKTYNCFIEVKSNFISKYQNSNNKVSYIKEHYPFVKWIETEDDCKTFVLSNLYCDFIPEKDEDDIEYWLNQEIIRKQKNKNKKGSIEKSQNEILKEERWLIINNCDIDFNKFGWVKELSNLFGISSNKAGSYVRKNFPEFYKTCFIRC